MKTTSLQPKNSVTRSHVRLALLLIPLACFALSPQVRATCQHACLSNQNTSLGDDALVNDTTGSANTAIGFNALLNTIDGINNTAVGFNALLNSVNGFFNTAVGSQALLSNISGAQNTAIGNAALQNNTTGNFNTATGVALESNTTGVANTATGVFALKANTTGNFNTAIGFDALKANTIGSENIALGRDAGAKLVQGSNDIYIGSKGDVRESNTIRLGNPVDHTATFIAGISGVTVAGGVGVIIDTNGQLGTVVSSARFKEEIKPMDKASEAILALNPVTFHYKHDLDPDGIPQFGLVAEQVEKVNPDLVARDAEGKPYTVRYEAVNAMLLNEFLKEHRKVEEQATKSQEQAATITKLESAVAQQQDEIKALTTTLKAQAAQIQKVSDELMTQAPAQRVVAND